MDNELHLSMPARSAWMRRCASATALLALVLLAAGCNTLRFNVAAGPTSSEVRERKSFFLWGLVPTERVDMRERCPSGVATIIDQTNLVDGLCNFVTLGIWSPRSTYYTCRVAPVGE